MTERELQEMTTRHGDNPIVCALVDEARETGMPFTEFVRKLADRLIGKNRELEDTLLVRRLTGND